MTVDNLSSGRLDLMVGRGNDLNQLLHPTLDPDAPRKLEEHLGWRRNYDLAATLRDVLAEWETRG